MLRGEYQHCLRLHSPQTDTDTRIWVEGVYLGGILKKTGKGGKPMAGAFRVDYGSKIGHDPTEDLLEDCAYRVSALFP